MDHGEFDFRQIHETYRPAVRRYLTGIVGEPNADDVTQEVFIKVDGALRSFRGASKISTWIYRIATNTAMDWLRSVRGENVSIDDIAEGPQTQGPSPEAALIRHEMRDCIRETVMALPAPYRVAIVLSEFEELSNAELADVLDISIDAAKIRLHRGRARLREALNAKCTLYRDGRGELACDRKSTFIDPRR